MVTLKIKIYDFEKNMDIFIIGNKILKYEFLMSSYCIKEFKLIQAENLKIIKKKDHDNNVSFLNEEKTSKQNANIPDLPGVRKK